MHLAGVLVNAQRSADPCSRFGLFTVAVALVLLLVAVLSAGSSRRELIPWVPLFITCSSLITVAIYELSQQTRARSIPQGVEEEFSGVSIDTWSDRSLRTVSGPLEPGLPFESTRFNPLYFALQGPSPRTSQRTSTNATELSLGSVAGRCRPQWDSQTRSFFPDDLPELGAQGGPHSGDSQGYENSQDPDPDSGSEHGTVNQPVLC